jgi:hypothetical protein
MLIGSNRGKFGLDCPLFNNMASIETLTPMPCVVNWLIKYHKILWTYVDLQGHVVQEGFRNTLTDKAVT